MTVTEAQLRATAKYKAKNYKRIPLDVRIEEYEELKQAADKAGESVNGYIKEALRRRIESEQVINLDELRERS